MAGDPRGVFGRYPPIQPGWFPDPRNRSSDALFRRRVVDAATRLRPSGSSASAVPPVQRRQVVRGCLRQRRIGRDAPRRTVPAGAGARMHASPLRQQLEGDPHRVAEAPVQPLVTAQTMCSPVDSRTDRVVQADGQPAHGRRNDCDAAPAATTESGTRCRNDGFGQFSSVKHVAGGLVVL